MPGDTAGEIDAYAQSKKIELNSVKYLKINTRVCDATFYWQIVFSRVTEWFTQTLCDCKHCFGRAKKTKFRLSSIKTVLTSVGQQREKCTKLIVGKSVFSGTPDRTDQGGRRGRSPREPRLGTPDTGKGPGKFSEENRNQMVETVSKCSRLHC